MHISSLIQTRQLFHCRKQCYGQKTHISQDVKRWTSVVWIIVMFFFSCLDSHSDGTHSLQRHPLKSMHQMFGIHFSKSVLIKKKKTHLHLGWPEGEYTFSKFSLLGEIPLKGNIWTVNLHLEKIPVYHEEPGGSILLRVSWWFLGREDPDEVLGWVPVSHSRNAHSQ